MINITSGKRVKAQKIVIYGVEGIGKSEMASCFPEPIFIDTEASTDHMDVSRTDAPTSWAMLMEQVMWLGNPNNHNFKTLVIDTIDWAERLCAQYVCQVGDEKGPKNSIGDFGWGKGPGYLADEMGKLLDLLTNVINSGINVILLGHAHIRRVDLPEESGSFDKYELRLEKKVAPLPKEWADAVFFLNYKTFLTGEGTKKKATGGRRVIHTNHKASFDAKNRYKLPQEVDFEGEPAKLYQSVAGFIPVRATGVIQPEAQQQPTNQQTAQPQQEMPASEAQPQEKASEPEASQAPTEAKANETSQGSTAFSGPLYDLMSQNNVQDSDLEQMAYRSGHFPEGMKLGEFPQEYLDHLVSSWSDVFESIKNHR